MTTKRLLQLLLTLVFVMALGACAKKTKPTEEGTTENPSAVSESDISSGNADSDSGKAMGLETVHYPYDSSVLDPQAKETLNNNVQIMKDKSGLKVQIEGHTDERGGIQYNLALGERRALAAKAYMVDKGVPANRIEVLSYGKEKPVDPGHDEGAWAKNRRANFRITEK